MNKKRKKGFIGMKFLVIGILALMFLLVVVPTVLNKNFWDDALDKINNFFQPPQIDPMETQRQKFENRRQAEEYYSAWLRAYETVINSDEETCYIDLPNVPDSMSENDYYILFASDSKNKIMTQLTQGGWPVVKPVSINTGLCMIIDDDDDKKILENFHEHLIKQFNPHRCTTSDPCHYFFLKDEGVHSNNWDQDQHLVEDFNLQKELSNIVKIQGVVTLEIPKPSEDENSISIKYTEAINNNPEDIINTDTTRLSEEQAFRLVKVNNEVCILPLDERTYTNNMFQKRNDLHYFKQEVFTFTKEYSYAKSDYKGLIPKCQKYSHQLLDNIINPIMIVFSNIRASLSDVHYPQKINYSEGKWEADFGLDKQINPVVGTKHLPRPSLTEYLNELLKNKDYVGGVKTLCDEFVFNQEITEPHPLTITLIEGLRCELIQRTQTTQTTQEQQATY